MGVHEAVDFSGRAGAAGAAVGLDVAAAEPFKNGLAWQPPPIVAYDTSALAEARLLFADSTCDSALTCALGSVADLSEIEEWRSHGAEVTVRGSDLSAQEITQAQLEARTGIAATLQGASIHHAVMPSNTSLCIIHVLPESGAPFEDLVWFWNHRALRPADDGASVLLRQQHLNDAAVCEFLRHAVTQRARGNPSVNVQSLSLPSEVLAEYTRGLGIARHEGSRWTEHLFGPRRRAQPTLVLNQDIRHNWLGMRASGTYQSAEMWFKDDLATLQFRPRLTFAPAFTGAGPVLLRLHGEALRAPEKSAVAQLFFPAARWDRGYLSWVTELAPEYDFTLTVPSRQAVLEAATAESFKISDKGRELSALAARLPNLEMFRNPAALAVVRALTPTTVGACGRS